MIKKMVRYRCKGIFNENYVMKEKRTLGNNIILKVMIKYSQDSIGPQFKYVHDTCEIYMS